jgi:hypothetical protein
VIAHPTHILRTTRSGSRRPGQRLNQSLTRGKGEPNRRMVIASDDQRIGEPDAKTPSPMMTVLDASPLLVILHYLLKNNIRIYEDDMCRFQHLPRGAPWAKGDTKGSPPHPREVGG